MLLLLLLLSVASPLLLCGEVVGDEVGEASGDVLSSSEAPLCDVVLGKSELLVVPESCCEDSNISAAAIRSVRFGQFDGLDLEIVIFH